MTSKCKGGKGQIIEDLVSYRKDLGRNLNVSVRYEGRVYDTMTLSLLMVGWANCSRLNAR